MLKIFMSRGGVPQAVAEWMGASGMAPMMILVILLVALIFLGMLMDSLSMILLAIPFFWPVLVEINGGDYVDAANAGFGMTSEDLKIWFWHSGAYRGGVGADHTACGHECLRDFSHGQGCAHA